MIYSLPRTEHLKSQRAIDTLFVEGRNFIAYPLRVVYHTHDSVDNAAAAQVMFIARKKRFRHAVERNRAKRLVHEAYRLNKHLLTDPCTKCGKQLTIAFMVISDTLPSFQQTEHAMQNALKKIADTLCANG